MKINFTLDVNDEVMKKAVADFDEEYSIEDLDRENAIANVMYALFSIGDYDDAINMANHFTEEDRDAIVELFSLYYTHFLAKKVCEKLGVSES